MEHSQAARHGVRRSRWVNAMVLGATLGFVAGAVHAQTAVTAVPTATPRVSDVSITARYSSEYAVAHSPIQAETIRVFGNYYFFDPARSTMGPVLSSLLGGFRASTGVIGLNRPVSLFDVQQEKSLSLPYVGLGYSRLWLTGQLSLNADVGVASQTGLNAARMHSLFGGIPSLDESAGDLRWAPVMAVNLRYSF